MTGARMKSTLRFISIAILTSAVLYGCKNGPIGIFASLGGETSLGTDASKGFKSASPSFVVELGANYYAGIGKLWKRSTTAASVWAPLGTLPNADTVYADSAVTVSTGPTMYVSFKDSQGATAGVWPMTGTSWGTRVDPAFPPAGTTLEKLLVANNQVFAVCSTASAATPPVVTYTVYFLSGGTTFTAITSLSDMAARPIGITSDGTNYWLAAGTKLYTDTVIAAGSFAALPDTPIAFTSLVYADATLELIATGGNGKIYQTTDNGTTWPASATFDKSGTAYYFSKAVLVPAAVDGTRRLLVATDARYLPALSASGGYLDFDVTNPAILTWSATQNVNKTPISDAINFDTTIGNNPVSELVLLGNTLFACTGGHGLWSNRYGSAWSTWLRESDK